jgi:hypothetical protein
VLKLLKEAHSFFVSRVDTAVDKRLEALGTEHSTMLKEKRGSPTPGWHTTSIAPAAGQLRRRSRWKTARPDHLCFNPVLSYVIGAVMS